MRRQRLPHHANFRTHSPHLALLLLAAAACSGSSSPGSDDGAVRHAYVIGCSHSGTTLLLRTVGNLPGMRCMPMEHRLFRKAEFASEAAKRARMAIWDEETRARRFQAWVEKTPDWRAHDLQALLALDPGAKLLVVVRDGRDVLASKTRSRKIGHLPLEFLANNWARCAGVSLAALDSPRAMLVRFEELTQQGTVLPVLRRIAAFLDVNASDERLLLALQPPRTLVNKTLCHQYSNEAEKQSELASSYLAGLSEAGKPRELVLRAQQEQRLMQAGDIPVFRRYQMRHAWHPVSSAWRAQLSAAHKAVLAGLPGFQTMLGCLNYSRSAGPADLEASGTAPPAAGDAATASAAAAAAVGVVR